MDLSLRTSNGYIFDIYIYIYTVRLILRVFLARINYILEHKLARRKEGEASSNYAFRERAETDTFRSRENRRSIDQRKKRKKKEEGGKEEEHEAVIFKKR